MPEETLGKWKPEPGEWVRCVKRTNYFTAGEKYVVARGPQRGCVGFYVRENLGYPVLVSMSSFRPVGEICQKKK
jgi:hypothetical protein